MEARLVLAKHEQCTPKIGDLTKHSQITDKYYTKDFLHMGLTSIIHTKFGNKFISSRAINM